MSMKNLKYLKESFGQDERVVFAARFHWFYDVMAYLNVIFGFLGAVAFLNVCIHFVPLGLGGSEESGLAAVRGLHPAIKGIAAAIFLYGVWRFVAMMIYKVNTEICVTNKRFVHKQGLVARDMGEMSMNRIESVNVSQSFLGRLLGYGRVSIHGMGEGHIVLPPIDQPIELRKAVMRAKDIDTRDIPETQAI